MRLRIGDAALRSPWAKIELVSDIDRSLEQQAGQKVVRSEQLHVGIGLARLRPALRKLQGQERKRPAEIGIRFGRMIGDLAHRDQTLQRARRIRREKNALPQRC